MKLPGTPSGSLKDQELVGPDESDRRARFFLRQMAWGIPLLFTAGALALWLLSKGSKGNAIAGTLSLPMSIVTSGLTILLFLCQNPPRGENAGNAGGAPPKSLRRALRLAALFTAVVVGPVAGVLYWTLWHKVDIPVTDQVSVSNGVKRMRDGDQVTIQIPGQPPQRRYLAIVPTLTNPSSVGDCVNPAKLDIVTVIDGWQRDSKSGVRPGRETELDLTGVTRQASLLVTLHVPDSFCEIDFGIAQAVLYN